MMNASSSNNEEIISSTTETVEVSEDFGCASDCVSASKEGALWEVGEDGDRSAGGELVQAFQRYYGACMATQC